MVSLSLAILVAGISLSAYLRKHNEAEELKGVIKMQNEIIEGFVTRMEHKS